MRVRLTGIFVNLYILLICVEPCKFLRVKQCFRLQFLFRKLNYVVPFILKIITSWNNGKKKTHQDNDEVIHGFLLKQRGKKHGLIRCFLILWSKLAILVIEIPNFINPIILLSLYCMPTFFLQQSPKRNVICPCNKCMSSSI